MQRPLCPNTIWTSRSPLSLRRVGGFFVHFPKLYAGLMSTFFISSHIQNSLFEWVISG